MKIEKEKIREEFKRDTYWTRIHFESDDGKRKATVLTCASWEYLLDTNRVNKLRAEHLNQWLDFVVKKWTSRGDDIFTQEIYYDVYTNTEEGKENGLQFLKEEVSA